MTLTLAQDVTSEVTHEGTPVGEVIPDDVTTSGPIIFNDLPDSTASPERQDNPIAYALVVVMAVLLVGCMVFAGFMMQKLAKYVPPDTASHIFQSGFKYGLEMALNQAGQTKRPEDDEFFEWLAAKRGLPVTKIKNPDGTMTYTVAYAPPPTETAAASAG